jgi:phosphoserine phosphatase
LIIRSVLKDAFVWLGGALATGVNKGGEFISSKIGQNNPVTVSDSTKSTLSNVKDKASQVVDVTGGLLMQLYRPVAEKTKELTEEISTKIDQSDNKCTSQIVNPIVLQQSKQLTVASWGAAGVAFEGLSTALGQVGTSIGTNTRSLVEKKYG